MPPADDTLKLSVPHKLTKAEARQRLASGLGKVGNQQFATVNERWTGDRMDFDVKAMGQSIAGWAVVHDDRVDIEVKLPWLLKAMAEKLRPMLAKHTGDVLRLPAPKAK